MTILRLHHFYLEVIVIASEARKTSVVSGFSGLPRFARNDDVRKYLTPSLDEIIFLSCPSTHILKNMQNLNPNAKEQENQIPKEAAQVLKVLEELENFTAELRKKVMAELKTNNNLVHLKLNDM